MMCGTWLVMVSFECQSLCHLQVASHIFDAVVKGSSKGNEFTRLLSVGLLQNTHL